MFIKISSRLRVGLVVLIGVRRQCQYQSLRNYLFRPPIHTSRNKMMKSVFNNRLLQQCDDRCVAIPTRIIHSRSAKLLGRAGREIRGCMPETRAGEERGGRGGLGKETQGNPQHSHSHTDPRRPKTQLDRAHNNKAAINGASSSRSGRPQTPGGRGESTS